MGAKAVDCRGSLFILSLGQWRVVTRHLCSSIRSREDTSGRDVVAALLARLELTIEAPLGRARSPAFDFA